jgi:hypothetical protein
MKFAFLVHIVLLDLFNVVYMGFFKHCIILLLCFVIYLSINFS